MDTIYLVTCWFHVDGYMHYHRQACILQQFGDTQNVDIEIILIELVMYDIWCFTVASLVQSKW